jgi:hypothetical protein
LPGYTIGTSWLWTFKAPIAGALYFREEPVLQLRVFQLFTFVFSIVAACNAVGAGRAYGESCVANGSPLPPAYKKVLRHCNALFHALPLDRKTREIVNPKEKVAHYATYRSTYLKFDSDCFFKWENLRCHTQEFLGDNVGALFQVGSSVPFCTAFRLTADVLMTAGHCKNGVAKGTVLRLYGHPLDEIHIGATIDFVPGGSVLPDLSDVAFFGLINPKAASKWSRQTFERTVIAGQAIFIIAPSLISTEAFDDTSVVENWLRQVRFSRATTNQIWLPSEVNPPVDAGPAREECLFHQNSTFPGMSGAPIIAATRPGEPDGVPTFHVIGIHLRNGVAAPDRNKGCGEHPEFNVGIKIPTFVLDALFENHARVERR